MAKLNEQGIKEQIKTSSFSNAYLIYGEESYLKDFYISQIIKKVIDPAFDSFNLHRFEGKDTSLDDIIKDAQMLPMMSEYNLVYVRDYPVEKSKNDMALIKEFLDDVPDTTIFILCYDSLAVDTKSAAFRKLITYFDNTGAVINMEKRSEREVAKLLVSGAKRRKATLSLDDAQYLISVSGNDMTVLLNELDKLCGFVQGGVITKEIIDNMATKCLQAKIYDLSKAVVSGNSQLAYNVLDGLFYMKEDPVRISSIIIGVYVDMYRVKCAKTAGQSYSDVAKHFNYKNREFALRNASRDCAEMSEQQLRASLDVIAETDVKLKSTAIDKRLLLEELVVKLIMIARENSYA